MVPVVAKQSIRHMSLISETQFYLSTSVKDNQEQLINYNVNAKSESNPQSMPCVCLLGVGGQLENRVESLFV